MVAIGDELAKVIVVRKRDYWLAAARKKILIWRRLTRDDSWAFADRGLVRYPLAADVQLMLSLADAPDEKVEGYLQRSSQANSNERCYFRQVSACKTEEPTLGDH
jgi:hypothetical protein